MCEHVLVIGACGIAYGADLGGLGDFAVVTFFTFTKFVFRSRDLATASTERPRVRVFANVDGLHTA